MAKITHSEARGPVSSTSIPSPASKNYVVEDLSNDIPITVDERLAEFEAPITQPVMPKLDVESKNKLESLIFMGRYTKTVELAGHKFEFSTLTHRENNEIVVKLMNIGDAADIFIVRALTLANSIKSIDGVALDSFEIGGQFDTALDRRTAVVDQMQLALVERLYAAYESLIKEADDVVYGEKIKN